MKGEKKIFFHDVLRDSFRHEASFGIQLRYTYIHIHMSLIRKGNSRSDVAKLFLAACNGTFDSQKHNHDGLLEDSSAKYSAYLKDLKQDVHLPGIGSVLNAIQAAPGEAVSYPLVCKLVKFLNEMSKLISCELRENVTVGRSISISILVNACSQIHIVLNSKNIDEQSPRAKDTYVPEVINIQNCSEKRLLPLDESAYSIFRNMTLIANVILQSLLFSANEKGEDGNTCNMQIMERLVISLLSMGSHVEDFDAVRFDSIFKSRDKTGKNGEQHTIAWQSFEDTFVSSSVFDTNNSDRGDLSGKKRKARA